MTRVIAIGTDLHKLSRFNIILKRNGPLNAFKTKRFGEKVLHPIYELPLFRYSLDNNDIDNCSKILSTAWCTKEAIYKTLDDDDQKLFEMNKWYKINEPSGRPLIGCDNYEKSEEFLCSISHDGDFVTAFVLRQLNSKIQ